MNPMMMQQMMGGGPRGSGAGAHIEPAADARQRYDADAARR